MTIILAVSNTEAASSSRCHPTEQSCYYITMATSLAMYPMHVKSMLTSLRAHQTISPSLDIPFSRASSGTNEISEALKLAPQPLFLRYRDALDRPSYDLSMVMDHPLAFLYSCMYRRQLSSQEMVSMN